MTLTAQPNAFGSLRSATQEIHQRVEARLRFTEPDLSREHYAQQLCALWGFISALEAGTAAYGESPDAWLDADRRMSPMLEADLASLGFSSDEVAALPKCSDLLPTGDYSQALARLYVMESATLGGQHLSRYFERHHPEWPTHFFNGYGHSVAALWLALRDRINRAVADDPAALEQIVAGATDIYEKLDRWLAEQLPEPRDASSTVN